MYFNIDEWDDSCDEIILTDEELNEEEDESAMYFDVPLPYRPVQLSPKPLRRNI